MLPGWGRSGRHVRKDGTPERFDLSFSRCVGIGGINMGPHSLALLQRPNAWTLHVVRGHCVTMDGSEVRSLLSSLRVRISEKLSRSRHKSFSVFGVVQQGTSTYSCYLDVPFQDFGHSMNAVKDTREAVDRFMQEHSQIKEPLQDFSQEWSTRRADEIVGRLLRLEAENRDLQAQLRDAIVRRRTEDLAAAEIFSGPRV